MGSHHGTGTKAINELLNKEQISNICIVIVRYFGGILLGAGPLSRAYLNSAKDVILNCEKKEIYKYKNLKINIDYPKYDKLLFKLKDLESKEKLIINEVKFDDSIELTMDIIEEEITNIIDLIETI